MTTTVDDIQQQVRDLRDQAEVREAVRRFDLDTLAHEIARGESIADERRLSAEDIADVHANAERIVRARVALAADARLPRLQAQEDAAREVARARLAEIDAQIKALTEERALVGTEAHAIAREREATARRAAPLHSLLNPAEVRYASELTHALEAARGRAQVARRTVAQRGGLLDRAKAEVLRWADAITKYGAGTADDRRVREGATRQQAAAQAEVERLEGMNVGALRAEAAAADAEATKLEARLAEHWQNIRERYGCTSAEPE